MVTPGVVAVKNASFFFSTITKSKVSGVPGVTTHEALPVPSAFTVYVQLNVWWSVVPPTTSVRTPSLRLPRPSATKRRTAAAGAMTPPTVTNPSKAKAVGPSTSLTLKSPASATDATRQATASIVSEHRVRCMGASLGLREPTARHRAGSEDSSTTPSRLHRGVVAVVGRRLEEVLGLVGPELRDHRVGVDDAVLQPAVRLLDLQDVDVLGRVAVLVELDRPAGILDGLARLANGGQEARAVLDVAVDGRRRGGDPAPGAVHGGMKIGRGALQPGLGQPPEPLVGGRGG